MYITLFKYNVYLVSTPHTDSLVLHHLGIYIYSAEYSRMVFQLFMG